MSFSKKKKTLFRDKVPSAIIDPPTPDIPPAPTPKPKPKPKPKTKIHMYQGREVVFSPGVKSVGSIKNK